MPRRRFGRPVALAVAGLLLSAAGAVTAVVATAIAGAPVEELVFAGGQALLALGYPAIGALVAARQPRNGCGWILIAIGLCQGISGGGYALGTLLPDSGWSDSLMWLANWIWFPSLALLVSFLLLLFPDGRLPSRRWRPFAGFAATVLLAGSAATAWVASLPVEEQAAVEPFEAVFTAALFGGLLVSGAGSVASVVQRFRRSHGVERQQLKWLAFGSAAAFSGVLLTFAAEEPLVLGPVLVLMLALPASIGAAILRYRLFDIDRLLARSASYLLLSGLLVAIYAAGVISLRPLVAGVAGESQLAVAMSTIAVAAAFGPARRRIQSVVDRRFNRARYDATRTVEHFSAWLRTQVDPGELTTELLHVVDRTVAPERAALWLREAPATPTSRRA